MFRQIPIEEDKGVVLKGIRSSYEFYICILAFIVGVLMTGGPWTIDDEYPRKI